VVKVKNKKGKMSNEGIISLLPKGNNNIPNKGQLQNEEVVVSFVLST
jgi:hypothetical protein